MHRPHEVNDGEAVRVAPHPNIADEFLNKASTIIAWAGNFGPHYREYIVTLPGLIGVTGTEEIPLRIGRDIQKRLPEGWLLPDRGVRFEITGPDYARDDELVKWTVLDYIDELSQLPPRS